MYITSLCYVYLSNGGNTYSLIKMKPYCQPTLIKTKKSKHQPPSGVSVLTLRNPVLSLSDSLGGLETTKGQIESVSQTFVPSIINASLLSSLWSFQSIFYQSFFCSLMSHQCFFLLLRLPFHLPFTLMSFIPLCPTPLSSGLVYLHQMDKVSPACLFLLRVCLCAASVLQYVSVYCSYLCLLSFSLHTAYLFSLPLHLWISPLSFLPSFLYCLVSPSLLNSR